MPHTIQPGEYSMGSGVREIGRREWKASRTFLRSPNGNRYSVYSIWNDGKVVLNYNWHDNNRNANNPSALLAPLFISHPAFLRGRVL